MYAKHFPSILKAFYEFFEKIFQSELRRLWKKGDQKWQKIKVWPWEWADSANMRSKFTLEYFCEIVCKKHETTSGTHSNIILKFEERYFKQIKVFESSNTWYDDTSVDKFEPVIEPQSHFQPEIMTPWGGRERGCGVGWARGCEKYSAL